VKSIFPEAQVLACASDKLRAKLLPVDYEKLPLIFIPKFYLGISFNMKLGHIRKTIFCLFL
jgi:hypothetical protein